MDYRNSIQKMIEDLKNNSRIVLQSCEISEPAGEALLERAEKQMGGPIPESIKNFYRQLNGFSLEWEHRVPEIRNENDSDRGAIRILPVQEVFKSWKDNVWFDDFEGGDRFKDVYPLDCFVPEACAALVKTDSGFKETVHYHYFGEELSDTGLGFDEWFERLLQSRGYWYFIKSLCTDMKDSWETENFLKNIGRIFDDIDLSLFQ